jgi:Resolvase, N terminal domain
MAEEKGCTMMARKRGAAIYVRVSTDKQTVENQVRELRQIAERRGWEVVAQYSDAGMSGSKGRGGSRLTLRNCRSCPQAADLSVVVGAVDAGVMMRAMMLWLLLHYQRILGLRNARGYCARKWMSS